MSSPSQQSMTPPPAIEPPTIKKLASGQKLVIYAVLVNFLTVGLQVALGDIAGLVAIIAVALSVIGIFRLASGFSYSVGIRILLVVLMFIPLINIIALLKLNSNATKALRAAGFKVGLLGAVLTEGNEVKMKYKERKEAWKQIKASFSNGKSKRQIFDELFPTYQDEKKLVTLIALFPTEERKKRYKLLNAALFVLLLFAIIRILPYVFAPLSNIFLGSGFNSSLPLPFLRAGGAVLAQLFLFLIMFVYIAVAAGVWRAQNYYYYALAGLLALPEITAGWGLNAVIVALSFYILKKMYPDYGLSGPKKDSGGEYIMFKEEAGADDSRKSSVVEKILLIVSGLMVVGYTIVVLLTVIVMQNPHLKERLLGKNKTEVVSQVSERSAPQAKQSNNDLAPQKSGQPPSVPVQKPAPVGLSKDTPPPSANKPVVQPRPTSAVTPAVAPPVAAPIPKTPPKPAKETVTEKKATVLEGRPALKKKQAVSKPKIIYSKMTTFGNKTEIASGSKEINDSYYLNEIEKLSAAIAKNPDESINYRHRGNAYDNLGNRKQAIEDWKKAAAMGDTIIQSYLSFLEIDWQS